MSFLVICELLGLFVNIFTADNKYFLCNRENLTQSAQMQLSNKQKLFQNFLPNLENMHQLLNTLKNR